MKPNLATAALFQPPTICWIGTRTTGTRSMTVPLRMGHRAKTPRPFPRMFLTQTSSECRITGGTSGLVELHDPLDHSIGSLFVAAVSSEPTTRAAGHGSISDPRSSSDPLDLVA